VQIQPARIYCQSALRSPRPEIWRPVPIQLHAVVIRISEIERLADAVITGTIQRNASAYKFAERVRQVRSCREQDREVIEPGDSTRRRCPQRFPICSDRCDGDTARRNECGTVAITLQQLKAEYSTIETEGSLQVNHFQVYMIDSHLRIQWPELAPIVLRVSIFDPHVAQRCSASRFCATLYNTDLSGFILNHMSSPPPDDSQTTGASASDPLNETSLAATRALEGSEAAGAVIGRYHLLQKIGEGGMGEVWLAEQKQPVRRRVALKVIKAGMDTREVVGRFESERQALALMDHPTIAKVYDAGSTPLGRPYFVMEYVAGLPITDYCDTHKLTTRERLELFIHVCEGVQHAHQKAIIHRDLKPSNILVGEVDGRPAPKIIDFGIAKALSQRLTEETMFTRVGAIIGTPEYMSPEQANSAGEDIDTRTDVYSLGVILYELLVGAPPLDLKKAAQHELLRKLQEDDAPKPSTKLRTLGDRSTLSARNRRTDLAVLTKQLRGDLDSIALKTLEKDRSRRYGSPSELSADILRYLKDEPVLATPPSAAYRLRKFAHRNRTLLVTLCAFALVLLVATGVSIWQAVRARKAESAAMVQRDRADREMAAAKAVSEFLQDDLLSQASTDSQGGADVKPDPDVKVRALVDRAAAKVGQKFAGKPSVESSIRATLGNTYRGLGLFDEADRQMRNAYNLSRRNRGADAPETLQILSDLGAIEADEGKFADAARTGETVFEARRRIFGPDAPQTIVALQSLAVDYLYLGHYARAEPLLVKALQIQSRSPGYDNLDTLNTSDSLATVYIDQGRYGEAEKLLRRGLESYRRVFGPEHPYTQREMFGLARCSFGKGDYAEAEQLASAVFESDRRLRGQEHSDTLSGARMLARIYLAEGKLTQAESLMKNTLQTLVRTLGPSHPDVAYNTGILAQIAERSGDYAKAEPLWRDGLATSRRSLGEKHPDTVNLMQSLANNLLEQHRYSESEAMLRAALADWGNPDADDWRPFYGRNSLGTALAYQKRYAEAEPLLLSGYKGMKDRAARIPADQQSKFREAGSRIVQLYKDWSKPVQAKEWQQITSIPYAGSTPRHDH
jgi:eukaryotic-like serine/threonine-protein kinase